MIAQLTEDERRETLVNHSDWNYVVKRRAFHRQFVLRDFSEAIGFLIRIALESEKIDHHPEWSNVYDKIDIWLTTHDANGVSKRDVLLMKAIERLL